MDYLLERYKDQAIIFTLFLIMLGAVKWLTIGIPVDNYGIIAAMNNTLNTIIAGIIMIYRILAIIMILEAFGIFYSRIRYEESKAKNCISLGILVLNISMLSVLVFYFTEANFEMVINDWFKLGIAVIIGAMFVGINKLNESIKELYF